MPRKGRKVRERKRNQMQEARDRRKNKQTYEPYKRALLDRNPAVSNTGPFTYVCSFCDALHFLNEKTRDGFSACCSNGKVRLPPIKQSPLIRELLSTNNCDSKNYKDNILKYNAAHAMVSFGAKIDANASGGPYMYKINGSVHHKIGALYSATPSDARYIQLYFYDCEVAADLRNNISQNEGCSNKLMHLLTKHLNEVNVFAQTFQKVADVIKRTPKDEQKDVRMVIFLDRCADHRRYGLPTSYDVAAVFKADDGCPIGERDVIVYPMGSEIQSLPNHSSSLDPLAYPLLFPYGDEGWKRKGIKHQGTRATTARNTVTQMEYTAYRLATRRNFSTLHNSGKLFLQWVCDMYVRIEGERLAYVRSHQEKLRAELYFNLHDAINSKAQEKGMAVGRMVILPSSFSGSYRNRHTNYLNAMAIVGKFGKPHLFITFTCNPDWEEIKDILGPSQKANFRPDIVVRVFHAKLKELIDEIERGDIFGRCAALIYTVEFQKRGLPHAHILVTLGGHDKVNSADVIDQMVSAEIPDKEKEPELYELVRKHMIHGPCGNLRPSSPCMQEGSCAKHFPKDFSTSTKENENGYPIYRRRDDGSTVDVRGVSIDNRFVVPYNPYLLMKYRAHINVEVCTTVKSIKYIYKYIYKGFDAANIQFMENKLNYDEVAGYLNARWVGSMEACWRIFGYKMHYQSHTVVPLECHLENLQRVVFEVGKEQQALNPRDTKLMGWFLLNETDQAAQKLLYIDIPYHYRWIDEEKRWRPRLRGSHKVVSRLNAVSPKHVELFHLRLLLLHVRGAKCFLDLRTVDGVTYSTYREAAIALGITQSSERFHETMNEAISFYTATKIRELFAITVALNLPNNVPELWATFKNAMTEDFIRNGMNKQQAENAALLEIEEILSTHNTDCVSLNLPAPSPDPIANEMDEETIPMAHETDFNRKYSMLNNEQKEVCDLLIQALSAPEKTSRMFFLNAPGGCGKSFVQETLIAYAKSVKKIPLPVAFTGIAASLIPGGRTLHNQFKLPLTLNETSVSGVEPNSAHARFLNSVDIIFWDEATMAPSNALTVVNRLFTDITPVENLKHSPFAGKVVLFSGDFRQTLPVVPHSGRAITVENCIKNNRLWPQIKHLYLRTNMRVNKGENEFAEYLLQVGEDRLPKDEGGRSIIDRRLFGEGNPVDYIYDNLKQDIDNETIHDKIILAPKNEQCAQINDIVLSKIEGESQEYLSMNSIDSDNNSDSLQIPVEFLNGIEVSGLPRHRLELKKGAIVLVMRNLNTARGIINGTRLKIIHMHVNSIDCKILTGLSKGERILIPRINLTASQNVLPFKMVRLQFPVTLAFAISINKSQGQTLNHVGIYLPSDIFGHGQLYVALSRTRSFNGVKIFLPNEIQDQIISGKTAFSIRNVVFSEVL